MSEIYKKDVLNYINAYERRIRKLEKELSKKDALIYKLKNDMGISRKTATPDFERRYYLKDLREAKCLTKNEVSKRIGIVPNTYINWENYGYIPTVLNAIDVADFFEVDVKNIRWGEMKDED